VAAMGRIPLTLRALLLVPLLAVAVDHVRATVVCGTEAQTCLEAAGRGWLGAAGIVLLVLYAAGLSVWVARAAGRPSAPGRRPSLPRLWLTSTVGVAAVCAAQALVAEAVGGPAPLGGGWLELTALCAAAGGLIAFALRAAPVAAALARELRPAAPRPRVALALAPSFPALPVRPARAPRTPATAGRAPPA
jgi:hypothetical protein